MATETFSPRFLELDAWSSADALAALYEGQLAAELGFGEVRANYLDSMHGHLTGRVTGAIVDAKAKCEALIELRGERGLPAEAVLAVGDGANDAPMIKEAGLGVAYKAKPRLREVPGALIDHNDLTALLWLQGIPRREWVA